MISVRCAARDLHTIAPGHLSVRIGDSSRRSEEIVEISNCAFQCDYYNDVQRESIIIYLLIIASKTITLACDLTPMNCIRLNCI